MGLQGRYSQVAPHDHFHYRTYDDAEDREDDPPDICFDTVNPPRLFLHVFFQPPLTFFKAGDLDANLILRHDRPRR